MTYNKEYFTDITTKNKNNYFPYINFLKNQGITLNNLNICDIGCARGEFIESINEENDCYGVDISSYAIKECQRKFKNKKDKFAVVNMNTKSVPWNKKFDLLTLFDVIEHLDNFENIKQLFIKNLKKGGNLLVTTPNANSILRFYSQYAFTGELDKTHTMLFTPYTLDFFLRRAGLKKIYLATPYNFYFKMNEVTKKFLYGGQIVALYQK